MGRPMKDSGVEWIREIPESWDIVRLKSLFDFGKGLPITKDNLEETGIPVISYGQIHAKFNTGVSLDERLYRYVSPQYLENHSDSLVSEGDILVADTSEDLDGCGNCSYVDRQITLFAGYHTIILRSKIERDNKYLAYSIQTDGWRSQLRRKVSGVKVFSVSKRMLGETVFVFPPIEEQSRIAAYLDKQCRNIDATSDKTTSSIEEYKKLKQAIITQAVTKGVRGERPMKDSGVEWIGEIPEEWRDVNPKALFMQRKGKALDGERQLTASQQYGVIYQDEYMCLTGNRVVTVEKDFSILKHVEIGDFVISMRSFQGGLEYSEKSGSISSAYVMLVPNLERVYSRYFRWLFKSSIYINALQSTSNLVRDGQAMRYTNFAEVRLIEPPIAEQREIADYLDTKCAAIDALIAQKQQLLTELQNYKKSLIYEYVTGKKEVPAV